jgi:hypothetical protein
VAQRPRACTQYSQSDISGGQLLLADGTSANRNNGAKIRASAQMRFDCAEQ